MSRYDPTLIPLALAREIVFEPAVLPPVIALEFAAVWRGVLTESYHGFAGAVRVENGLLGPRSAKRYAVGNTKNTINAICARRKIHDLACRAIIKGGLDSVGRVGRAVAVR